MSSSDIKLLPSGMSFSTGNVAENWRRFKQKMEFYLRAHTGTATGNKKKIGLLMTALGDAGLDIYNTFGDIDDDSTYDEVIKKFDNYCNPRKNTVYERFVFSKLVQSAESVDAFVVQLKTQARRCEFHDEELPKLVRDRLVVGINNAKVRTEMLRDPDLTLDKALALAKAWETSDREAADMSLALPANLHAKNEFQVDKIRTTASLSTPRSKCSNCGYEHRTDNCPASDKECNYCHKMGHFASVCRKKASKPAVSAVSVTPDPDLSHDMTQTPPSKSIEVLKLYVITSSSGATAWHTNVQVGDRQFRFKIDSGAECNTLLLADYNRLSRRPALQPSSAALRPYGESELIFPVGELVINVRYKGRWHKVKFFVVEFTSKTPRSVDNILGLPTIEIIGMVKRTFEVTTVTESKPHIFSVYSDVFDGILGDIPGHSSLSVKPGARPVIEKPRRFPFALKQKLCSALTDLESSTVISRVDQPTEWVSNLIAVTKPNGSLRICLDPKYLNEALLVPKCEIPRCDDIFAELFDKRYFTVFDLKDGFWQVKLDYESSLLTTFNSPLGRFRWNRLVMGISSAPEIFMNKMRELFGDIQGVYPYFDDLIVTGTDEADHDANLESVLQRARQVGIKFNPTKVQYKQSSVNYLGFQVSSSGVKPLAKHIEAITNMPRPTDRNGVLRILGMIRYLARFLPNLSTNTEALRSLTHKEIAFTWLPEHEKEFRAIKEQIQKATDLRFYNPSEPLFVQTDSSQSGVGCCLFQNQAPIAYASRALTRTEQNYAQIEKELLAVVFSLEKFHDYTYGRHVTVHSDHRPLVSIVKKPIADLTPRIQRLRLRLLRYNFELVFQPGKELYVADTLSRAFLSHEPADETYQNFDVHSCTNVVASSEKLAELVAATAADPDFQKLKVYLRGGWPKSKTKLTPLLRKFRTFADNLNFRDNLLLFRNRIVVPTSLISKMLGILHAGHLNVNKTKQLARNTLFWIGMSTDIELFVASCDECNKFRKNQPPEELLPFPCPTRPWQRLHTDIFTHNSVNYLVVYDAYSQWVEMFTLRTKAMPELILHFKSLFARFGVPSEIVSDNVPYNSADWLAFADAWGFAVLFSSPRYPQANGASEKAVAIAKRILQKNIHLHYALLQYRNAPIPHLGYSPAQLLMGRALRTRIPVVEEKLFPTLVDRALVHERKLRQQSSQKYYHDRGASTLPPLQVGDEIYFKKELTDTQWKPGVVTSVGPNPRAYAVQDNESHGQYLRNRRFIRKPARFRDDQ